MNYRFYGRLKGKNYSTTQKTFIEEDLPNLTFDFKSVNYDNLFNGDNRSKKVLEIGFGYGEHLAACAINNPDTGFIGVEAYLQGVASLVSKVKEHNLNNVKIIHHDARDLLDSLPDQYLDEIVILFPDPWPKKRHNKRRIICEENIQKFLRILKNGGIIKAATDDPNYAESIEELMGKHFNLEMKEQSISLNKKNDWPVTRYESKAGDTICNYFIYRK